MTITEGMVIQGDGSRSDNSAVHDPPRLYVVQSGRLQVIPNARAFREAGYSPADVHVVPDDELAALPVAQAQDLLPGQSLALDLDTFLGAGHYMTTHGALSRTASGGHVDVTTRTRTITMFGGFHGGVNIIFYDAAGIPRGQTDTHVFGVDGTWIGRSDRTDYWSADLTPDVANATTGIAIFHFWSPSSIQDQIAKAVAIAKPIVDLIADVIKLGGGAKKSN